MHQLLVMEGNPRNYVVVLAYFVFRSQLQMHSIIDG